MGPNQDQTIQLLAFFSCSGCLVSYWCQSWKDSCYLPLVSVACCHRWLVTRTNRPWWMQWKNHLPAKTTMVQSQRKPKRRHKKCRVAVMVQAGEEIHNDAVNLLALQKGGRHFCDLLGCSVCPMIEYFSSFTIKTQVAKMCYRLCIVVLSTIIYCNRKNSLCFNLRQNGTSNIE
jgi:hypothetical protein